MSKEKGMTKEQKKVWALNYQSRKFFSSPNKHRVTFWKRFKEGNLYVLTDNSNETIKLAYHQVGKDNRPIKFFESFEIELKGE